MLFLGSLFFLFTSENRASERYRALKGTLGDVRRVDASVIDPSNEGKLVTISGPLEGAQRLTDVDFGVSALAVRLRRTVKMYQWHETLENGAASYFLDFSDEMIESNRFVTSQGHENPIEPLFPEVTMDTQGARIGAFDFPIELLLRLDQWVPHPIVEPFVPPATLEAEFESKNLRHHLSEGELFIGEDPLRPMVGDVRVLYATLAPAVLQALGIQAGSTLKHFGPENGLKFLVLKPEGAEMLPGLSQGGMQRIWLFRVVALLLSWFAMAALAPGLGGAGRGTPLRLAGLHLMVALAALLGVAAWLWTSASLSRTVALAVVALVLLCWSRILVVRAGGRATE